MTKLWVPGSIEGALDKAIGDLGIDVVAQRLGKSASLVRKYADPDDDARRLSAEDALTIDRWLSREHYPQYFALLFADQAEQNQKTTEAIERHERPLSLATRMVCGAADMADEIQKAGADGVFDVGEIDYLLQQIQRFQKCIGPLQQALAAQKSAKAGA